MVRSSTGCGGSCERCECAGSAFEPTVFLVDEDPAVRDSLAVALESSGFRVLAFARAEPFIAACHADMAGCLIADLDLADVPGTELVRLLHARRIVLPVVLTSARLRNQRLRRRLPPGVVALLEKPFSFAELMTRVDRAVFGKGGGAMHDFPPMMAMP